MDKLFGLPAHPFLVHTPIVLLPLAALGTLAIAVRRSWYWTYRWVVLAVAAAGTLGAVLAASAGEELEGRITAIEGPQAAASWEHHAQLGETARNAALVYLVLLAAFVVIPGLLRRRQSMAAPNEQAATAAPDGGDADERSRSGAPGPRWLPPLLAVLAVAGAVGSVVTIIEAGHTGSKSVWHDVVDGSG